MRICGNDQARASWHFFGSGYDSGIVAGVERGITEVLLEQITDKFVGHQATAAMPNHNLIVLIEWQRADRSLHSGESWLAHSFTRW